MIKVAIITGVSGQDGLYLSELLISKKYLIIGIVRNIENTRKKIAAFFFDNVELVEWDFLNQDVITNIVRKYRPLEIYNLAAFSTGAGMFNNPVEIGEINGLAVTRLLEAIRTTNNQIKFCQASSREIFGEAFESPQSELTPRLPRSPYGAAKAYADSMIRIYRERYNIFACSAILYNHESPRRSMEFVTRKITHTAACIKLGLNSKLHLGNLDTARDWGFAGDTVHAMWLMLQHDTPGEYVIATGKAHTVREFCQSTFRYLGLNYLDHVQEDADSFRPSEASVLVGDSYKARSQLGWVNKISFNELVKMMVDADMQSLLEKNNN